jgi:hypothetical protein
MSVTGAQPFNGAIDDRARRLDEWIPDTQDDHILATRTCLCGLVMRIPGVRAITADPIDQSGKLHIRKTPHPVGGQKCSPHITVPDSGRAS